MNTPVPDVLRAQVNARPAAATGIVLAVALAVAPASAHSQDVKAAIVAANKEFSAVYAKGDAAKVATMYSPDAEMLPPNGEVVRGTAAIQKAWEELIAMGAPTLTLTTREAEGHGDTAHEVGTWELKGKDGALIDRGKYIVIWKKYGGQWKLHRDIWNSSMPPAKP